MAHLKTLALTSCNVLDVYDYNNIRVGPLRARNRISGNDPVSKRTAPGINWWLASRYNAGQNDGPILLGYNYPVQVIKIADVMQGYQAQLRQLRLSGVDEQFLQQYAWLKANAVIRFRSRSGSPRNACAWDESFYYYISYTDPSSPQLKYVRIPVSRIPNLNGSPSTGAVASPLQSDQTLNGLPPFAEEFQIP